MTSTHKSPSTNGDNGRDTQGRFAPGNSGGPGNPFARRTAELRSLMLQSVTEEDFRAIIAKLVEKAKKGDLAATREVLTRLFGKPDAAIDPDRVEVDAMQKAHERAEAEEACEHDEMFARIRFF
ncbi:MAG: DUF5681 domain-containing protein [Gammaproteobacteria bacterium]